MKLNKEIREMIIHCMIDGYTKTPGSPEIAKRLGYSQKSVNNWMNIMAKDGLILKNGKKFSLIRKKGIGFCSKTNMKDIEVTINYPPSSKKSWDYKTSLKKWLSKDIEFSKIGYANFSSSMVLGVVEFDKDHCIYVLLPEDVFKGDKL